MSEQIDFKDNSFSTNLVSFIIFMSAFMAIQVLLFLVFGATAIGTIYAIVSGLAGGWLIERYYRKNKIKRSQSAKLDSYNDNLSKYVDFEGFDEKVFNLLFCGYYIVYHGNVKAIVTFRDNKFHIKWEDTKRNLFFNEVVNTNQNGMNKISTVGDFFSSRFKKLHFSFDWDNLY
jgi:hypothetical protein